MKPQALQDAIKLQAAQRKERAAKKEWKDPYVKKHVITADEFRQAKESKKSTVQMPHVSSCLTSSAPSETNNMVQQMQNMKHEFIKEKESLLSDMMNFKEEIDQCRSLMEGMDVDNLRKEISSLRELVSDLQDENKSLKQDILKMANGVSKPSSQRPSQPYLASPTSTLKNTKPNMNVEDLTPPATPYDTKKSLPSSSFSEGPENYSTPPGTPGEKSRHSLASEPLAMTPGTYKMRNELENIANGLELPTSPKKKTTMEPLTAAKIARWQGKDKILRDFLKEDNPTSLQTTQLFPKKLMSIKEIDGHMIVHFKKRIYVPPKLREKTTKWFLDNHSKNLALLEMSNNFIWPKMEHDLDDMYTQKGLQQ